MSSTVTNVGPLRCLLPEGSWLGTLVRHAICRGGMGHDNLRTTPGHDRISGRAPSMGLSLAPPAMSAGLAQRKRKSRYL